jgi:hypothetical protein
MTEPVKPPCRQYAVNGIEHLVHDGTRWVPLDENVADWMLSALRDFVTTAAVGARAICDDIIATESVARGAR